MRKWISLCDGRPQRLAALQQLHEALAAYEPLVREDLSVRHARLEGSLGELQDLHVEVCTLPEASRGQELQTEA